MTRLAFRLNTPLDVFAASQGVSRARRLIFVFAANQSHREVHETARVSRQQGKPATHAMKTNKNIHKSKSLFPHFKSIQSALDRKGKSESCRSRFKKIK